MFIRSEFLFAVHNLRLSTVSLIDDGILLSLCSEFGESESLDVLFVEKHLFSDTLGAYASSLNMAVYSTSRDGESTSCFISVDSEGHKGVFSISYRVFVWQNKKPI
jgi:hypothetical protein